MPRNGSGVKKEQAAPDRLEPDDRERVIVWAMRRGFTTPEVDHAIEAVLLWGQESGRRKRDWALTVMRGMLTGWALRGYRTAPARKPEPPKPPPPPPPRGSLAPSVEKYLDEAGTLPFKPSPPDPHRLPREPTPKFGGPIPWPRSRQVAVERLNFRGIMEPSEEQIRLEFMQFPDLLGPYEGK